MDTGRSDKLKRELKSQILTFIGVLFLTILAFIVVITDKFSSNFITLFIVTLAIIQVGFQFYYFMHLKDKKNGEISILLYGGLLISVLTVITCLFIVWL